MVDPTDAAAIHAGDGRVLLVHTDRTLARAFSRLLTQRGHRVTAVSDLDDAAADIEQGHFAVVVIDHDDHDGALLLSRLRKHFAHIRRVVLSTANIAGETWVQRPVVPEHLISAVSDPRVANATDRPRARLGENASDASEVERSVAAPLPVIVRRAADGGFTAECPILAKCIAHGETRDEAIAAVRRAIGDAAQRGEGLTGEVVNVSINE
jgi:CheY-like chemotaxis protein